MSRFPETVKSTLLGIVSGMAKEPSAFVQQRTKPLPDAFRHVFHRFNSAFPPDSFHNGMLLVACDRTDVAFAGTPADTEYFSSPGLSVKGTCSMHVSALYDLLGRRYLNAVSSPATRKMSSVRSAAWWTLSRQNMPRPPYLCTIKGILSCAC